jgi:hypothetical protein
MYTGTTPSPCCAGTRRRVFASRVRREGWRRPAIGSSFFRRGQGLGTPGRSLRRCLRSRSLASPDANAGRKARRAGRRGASSCPSAFAGAYPNRSPLLSLSRHGMRGVRGHMQPNARHESTTPEHTRKNCGARTHGRVRVRVWGRSASGASGPPSDLGTRRPSRRGSLLPRVASTSAVRVQEGRQDNRVGRPCRTVYYRNVARSTVRRRRWGCREGVR